jgi:hypothetical protein
MSTGIVTKPPKPGFVGFGSTYLGDYQDFLAEYFSGLPGEGAFISGVIFLRPAPIIAAEPKRVVGPTKSLNDSSHGG